MAHHSQKLHKAIQNTPVQPIMPEPLTPGNTVHIDLSPQNKDSEFIRVSNSATMAAYAQKVVQEAGKKYAYGGYGERRIFYQRFAQYRNTGAPRCIHLGIDVWAPAGTAIHTPLSANVHSTAVNDQPGDYGGTIILQHRVQEITFYTLHGHLSFASANALATEQKLPAGARIGELGTEAENGGWPPHLHFQVILNIGDYRGDYPGVATEKEAPGFLRNCPDPKVFFDFLEF